MPTASKRLTSSERSSKECFLPAQQRGDDPRNQKYIRADDEVYGIGYEYFLGKHAEGLVVMPDRKGVDLVIAQMAKSNPKAKGQTIESLKVLDSSILDYLKKSGFIDKLRS